MAVISTEEVGLRHNWTIEELREIAGVIQNCPPNEAFRGLRIHSRLFSARLITGPASKKRRFMKKAPW